MKAFYIAYNETAENGAPKAYIVEGELEEIDGRRFFKLEKDLSWLGSGGCLGENLFALSEEELKSKIHTFYILEIEKISNQLSWLAKKLTLPPILASLGSSKKKGSSE